MTLLLAIVAVVVLKKWGRLVGDDKSYESASRSETDRKKERAASAAGAWLVRWQVKSLPDPATIAGVMSEQRP